VMVDISKEHVANIISEIKQMKLAQNIDTTDIDAAADKVLKN
jgi:hypothetical protein